MEENVYFTKNDGEVVERFKELLEFVGCHSVFKSKVKEDVLPSDIVILTKGGSVEIYYKELLEIKLSKYSNKVSYRFGKEWYDPELNDMVQDFRLYFSMYFLKVRLPALQLVFEHLAKMLGGKIEKGDSPRAEEAMIGISDGAGVYIQYYRCGNVVLTSKDITLILEDNLGKTYRHFSFDAVRIPSLKQDGINSEALYDFLYYRVDEYIPQHPIEFIQPVF